MLTKAMERLVVDYAAYAEQKGSLEETEWESLEKRLATAEGAITRTIEALDDEYKAKLWDAVIEKRVRLANAHGAFQTINWKRLEGQAVYTLLTLVENNLVRNPDQLLAIAKTAEQINKGLVDPRGNRSGGGATVNIHMGDFKGDLAMHDESETPRIPGTAGETIRIDLSPRTAEALKDRRPHREGRVLDSQRVEAEELRAIANGEGGIEQYREEVDE